MQAGGFLICGLKGGGRPARAGKKTEVRNRGGGALNPGVLA